MAENRVKERILKLLKQYPEGLTISHIAKEVGMHRHSVVKYIYELTGEKKIIQRKIGSATLCYIYRKNTTNCKKYLSLGIFLVFILLTPTAKAAIDLEREVSDSVTFNFVQDRSNDISNVDLEREVSDSVTFNFVQDRSNDISNVDLEREVSDSVTLNFFIGMLSIINRALGEIFSLTGSGRRLEESVNNPLLTNTIIAIDPNHITWNPINVTMLSVQSYPIFGENWIIVNNHSFSESGYETSKAILIEEHYLGLRFSNDIAYACGDDGIAFDAANNITSHYLKEPYKRSRKL